jgi:hypothetical protein
LWLQTSTRIPVRPPWPVMRIDLLCLLPCLTTWHQIPENHSIIETRASPTLSGSKPAGPGNLRWRTVWPPLWQCCGVTSGLTDSTSTAVTMTGWLVHHLAQHVSWHSDIIPNLPNYTILHVRFHILRPMIMNITIFFCNPISFTVCTSTFSKSIYIKMYCPFVRLCPCARKSPKVLHRWRWNLDTTLQANTRVVRFNVYIYIYEKTCF